MAERNPDAGQQFADAEGLFDIVIGTQVERCDLFDFLVPGGKHDDGDGRKGSHGRDDGLAVTIGQTEVQHDEGRSAGRGKALGLGGSASGFDLEAGGGQRRPEEALNLRLVIDNQDTRQHQDGFPGSACGRRMVIRVPRLRVAGLVALMVPPMAVIRPRAMERPRPVPAGRPSPLARR